jgi:hypothetical protein
MKESLDEKRNASKVTARRISPRKDTEETRKKSVGSRQRVAGRPPMELTIGDSLLTLFCVSSVFFRG